MTLFEEANPFAGKNRIENFTPEFRVFIDDKYGHHYSPEEILGYIYAVLYSPTYRKKYAEFLKTDFPRIPFVDDLKEFEALSKLGSQLMQAHPLKDIPAKIKVDVSKNDDPVEKPVYDHENQRLYANKNLFFSPVPEAVWNFHIGGYRVLENYLKSRKDRKLTLDEKENIIDAIKALVFTIDQTIKIDETYKS